MPKGTFYVVTLRRFGEVADKRYALITEDDLGSQRGFKGRGYVVHVESMNFINFTQQVAGWMAALAGNYAQFQISTMPPPEDELLFTPVGWTVEDVGALSEDFRTAFKAEFARYIAEKRQKDDAA